MRPTLAHDRACHPTRTVAVGGAPCRLVFKVVLPALHPVIKDRMRPYSRPALTPLGTVQQLTLSKTPSIPGVVGKVPGTGVLPVAQTYGPT